ncbi:ATP-binding protein [Nonomuraea sp. SYSU D8015]|uniref:ATP-binding protein n=1 Tax=Nonomuraea sp. SYSU D8015 TaxID=2593644 RepID=UPI001660BC86|nr:tetratricopeptide repeat protein [Nonomuraea sp. SYSU D8015]
MPSNAQDNGQAGSAAQDATPGALVRAWRERALFTQEELAARAGLNTRTVRRLETGELRRPRGSSMRSLAEALGLTADEFALLTRVASPIPDVPPATRMRVVPRQLPTDVAAFVGRERELAVADEARAEGTVVITAIDGMGGVGKTALAVHWAHRVAGRFPDGQLYVDLQGYASGPPLSAMQALAVLLRALGVLAEQVPMGLEEAAALYRSLLAGKRVLVVLDNAYGAEQVRPLLPGSPGCMVVVTSRDRLTGLVATHGAHRLTLDVLDPGEAAALLEQIVGRERVAAEPRAAAELARVCGHLPLALRIAAANLSRGPEQPIADYLAELQAGDPLDGLTVAHDPQAAVRLAFDHSYHRLTADHRRLYGLLGLVPGPDVGVAGAAALAGLRTEDARRALEELADAHLVQLRGRDRYGMHDLLALYARRRAEQHHGRAGCEAALERLLDWYLAGIGAAAELLYPEEVRLPHAPAAPTALPPGEPASPPPGVPTPPTFADPPQAAAWLEAELPSLVAATLHAAGRVGESGPHPAAWRLADALRGFFWQRRPMVEWFLIAQAGLDAATAAGDVRAQVSGHLSLCQANRAASRREPARRHITRALTLARRAGWTDGQAAALSCEANVAWMAGDLRQAVDGLTQAVALYRRSGWAGGEADSLIDLGLIEMERGLLHVAATHFTQALEIYRQIGSRIGQTTALGALGEIDHLLGRSVAARQRVLGGLRLFQELGLRFGRVYFLRCLAELDRDTGHAKQALAHAQDALRLTGEIGDRSTEVRVRIVLGGVHLNLRDAQAAGDHYRQALELAQQIPSRTREAEARLGLAYVSLALDQPRQALDGARHALGLATAAGMRVVQGYAHTVLTLAHHRLGHHDQALTHARQAVELHRQSGHRLGEARALQALGRALRGAGDLQTAEHRWQEALELFTDLASPAAEEIRTLLDT